MKNLCLVILVLHHVLVNPTTTVDGCFITKGFAIHMITEITYDNVMVHCQSREDDLGVHVLNFTNLEYGWSFCENFIESTLYHCSFWRSTSRDQQAFQVFNRTMFKVCYQGFSEANTCHWGIKADGFYLFDNFDRVWLKQYEWNHRRQLPQMLINQSELLVYP
ncbi:hypothetical protein R6Q57_017201 [Mikania cordata]